MNIKKIIFIFTGVLFLFSFTGGNIFALEDSYGASGVEENIEYSIEEMLTYAIEDEYIERGEYELIIDEYGSIRPFNNIIKAEENHISMLEPLFNKYDIAVPDDLSKEYVSLPATLNESFVVGVEAEINNINMYEKFLSQDNLPDDIRSLFERLRDASKNHLRAFERNVDKEQISERGRGRVR